MKVSDLMIGDYILVKPSMMPIKVVAVHNKKIGYHAVTHKLNWVREGLLEPIPITPEILEKNGFSGEMYAIFKIDEHIWLEYYYHEHRLSRWWRGIDEWNNHAEVSEVSFECQCHYVHELQMAFKLCKVNKEIVL